LQLVLNISDLTETRSRKKSRLSRSIFFEISIPERPSQSGVYWIRVSTLFFYFSRNWATADNSASKYPDNRNYNSNTVNNNGPYLYRSQNIPSRFGNGWFVQCTTRNCATG